MNGTYSYTLAIWPSIFTVLLLLALAVFSGRRRSVPGAIPFTVGCLLASLWAASSAMEYAALDVATKITWVKFQGALQLPATTAVTCFILEYTWPGRWLTRRNLAFLALIILVREGLILTNNLHHLMWLRYTFNLNGSVSVEREPAALLLTIIVYAFALLEFAALGWLFFKSRQHRWPVFLMLIGVVDHCYQHSAPRGELRAIKNPCSVAT